MTRTALDKIGTDRRSQAAFISLGVAVAILSGLITASVAVVGIVLGVTAIVSGLCREMSSRRTAAHRR